MKLRLTRTAQSSHGTFGMLTLDDIPLCNTCEDPWNNNHIGDSCIPPGVYQCVPHNGAKFQDVWEITNVPGRSAILIHAGNTIADTHGCVLVGNGFAFGQPTIIDSRMTLDALRKRLPPGFTLEIVNAF